MSKYKLYSVLLLILTVFNISCTNDSVSKTELSSTELSSTELSSTKSFNNDELKDYGKLHSEGVLYIIDKFNKTNFKTSNNTFDTLALINFAEQATREYLADKTISINGKTYPATNNFKVSDYQKVEFIRNMYSNDQQLSDNPYVNQLSEQIYNKLLISNSTIELDNELSFIKYDAELKLYNEEELTVILSMISVANDSYNLWYGSNGIAKTSAVNKGWFSLAVADAVGAYQWGSIGSLAGPAGAAIVGLNGAIINSSVAYLSSQI